MLQRSRVSPLPFIVLTIALLLFGMSSAPAATPEKPYPALQEGDRLNAYWLMGMFNVIYDWAQSSHASATVHVADTAAHGTTGAVVGTTNTQSLQNKSLDSTNSIVGEAITSGTIADARVAATISRDSELTAAIAGHASTAATHGVGSAIIGTSDAQTLYNKTIGSSNSVTGEAINNGTVADDRIASTLARDSEVSAAVSAHAAVTNTHGVSGAIVGTTSGQTISNKNLDSSNAIVGDSINSGTVADARIAGTIARDSEVSAAVSAHAGTGATHGLGSQIVGVADTQTMTNKTIYKSADGSIPYWHATNDGSGSGLDADLLDGYHLSSTPGAPSTVVMRDANGYANFGWINTASGDNGVNALERIYGGSNDGYIRFYTPSNFKTVMGLHYGSTAGTVCQGNDSRLSDARTPVSHGHGYAEISGLGNSATRNVGTSAGTVCAGDDGRLSDARTPVSHGHANTDISGLGNSSTRNVGTTAGTVCAGDDSRLSDARTPTTHGHSYDYISGLGNSATRNVGTTAGTVCAGDDSRLSDARTPVAHTHLYAGSSSAGGEATSAAYATNAGYATSAGSATNATNATNASYATSAGSATSATTAGSADYATSAGSATSATSATTATTATTANGIRTSAPGSPADGEIWLE